MAATDAGAPQAFNTFIPNWEASGKLAVGFSRNPARFKLNQYVQYIKTPKIRGYWLKFTNQNQGRVIDQARYLWPYGDPRPRPLNPETFKWIEFNLIRRSYTYGLDIDTVNQADFNVLEVERQNKATLAMTARTDRAVTTLTTAANWQTTADPDLSANHTDTGTNLAGGKLDVGTSTSPNLQIAVNKVAALINKDTMGVIDSKPENYMMVMNPNDAQRIAKSAEYHDYLKSSPNAYQEVIGRLHPNSFYGLPSTLYGVSLVIENAVKVTSEPINDTLARSYIWPDSSIAFISRQGGMEGVYGESNFSTYVMFCKEDMTVEEFTDAKDKMVEGRVLEETDDKVVCPASGYLVTAATN